MNVYICTGSYNMKYTVYPLICLLLLGFTQCKPKRDPNKVYFETPSEYNDFIVKEQKEVMAAFDDYASAVNQGNVDSMTYYHSQLNKRSQLAQASVSKMADFKGDTLFRTAAIELFSFINHACEHELGEIVDLAAKDSNITDIDIEKIRQLSDTYTLGEKEKNDALITAQESFTKKFNVTVK